MALGLVAVAATLLGIRSVRRTVRWWELRFADLHAVVPFAIGLLGVLNLLSAIWPREPAMMRELGPLAAARGDASAAARSCCSPGWRCCR